MTLQQPASPTQVMLACTTRLDAVCLAPVALALQQADDFDVTLVDIGTQPGEVETALAPFGLQPALELGERLNSGGPGSTLSRSLKRFDRLFAIRRPDLLMVAGASLTSVAAVLAAHQRGIPVASLEDQNLAGSAALDPSLGELIARLASLQFSASSGRDGRHAEDSILALGNPLTDALFWLKDKLRRGPRRGPGYADAALPMAAGPLLLVTAQPHRQWSEGLLELALAVHRLAGTHPQVQVVFSVDLAQELEAPLRRLLAGSDNLMLCAPPNAAAFRALALRATLLLSETAECRPLAEVLGVPLLVVDELGSEEARVERIVTAISALLDDPLAAARLRLAQYPLHDGRASQRIVERLRGFLQERRGVCA